ncbi:MAG TPA: hypothetical protein VJ964_01845 [Balneolaceae bacterium]|nr:hypothetical protein [Balneolaceae bacterium]
MKYLLSVVGFLLIQSSCIYAQVIEGVNFDSKKGEYIISYEWDNNTVKKGFYVPANGVKPFVDGSVAYDSVSNKYIYSYELKNEEGAYHPLYSFVLKIESSPNNLTEPNKDWWGRYEENMGACLWSKTGSYIPGIQPGNVEKGFEFTSKNLPTFISGSTSSLTDIYFPDIEGELPYRLSLVIDSLRNLTTPIKIKTIGPRQLPDNIGSTALVDTLQSYLTFSCDTTWIENKGVCRSLEARLDNIDRQLEQGRQNTAANDLQALLNELDVIKEKQISSEAYGLLYFNGQFLLDKLRE